MRGLLFPTQPTPEGTSGDWWQSEPAPLASGFHSAPRPPRRLALSKSGLSWVWGCIWETLCSRCLKPSVNLCVSVPSRVRGKQGLQATLQPPVWGSPLSPRPAGKDMGWQQRLRDELCLPSGALGSRCGWGRGACRSTETWACGQSRRRGGALPGLGCLMDSSVDQSASTATILAAERVGGGGFPGH